MVNSVVCPRCSRSMPHSSGTALGNACPNCLMELLFADDLPLANADRLPAPLLAVPVVPSIDSVPQFLEALRVYRLLEPTQCTAAARGKDTTTARALAGDLVQRGWLTPYQVNQLFQGRGQELIVGPYRLLERLGEGGIGQVFKARHVQMRRTVALKLIRKELVAEPEVVRRFYREIEVVSQLDHPHVVHAFDAGPTENTHYLAMEYVEGTDLARHVKQSGPLPPAQASEYVRQAALGLQHAFERGLVHRDIKPGNLLITQNKVDGSALVKVADLGLARLQRSTQGAGTVDPQAPRSLTPVGAVLLGTADYLAPEQALDFHRADIRADIYSLGCTLFYLLTGRPPFEGGTVVEKLWRHQQAAPPTIEGLPPDLTAVLNRMLAKQPGDRFQTPKDAATALTVLAGSGPPTCSSAQAAAVAPALNAPTFAIPAALPVQRPDGELLLADRAQQRGDDTRVLGPPKAAETPPSESARPRQRRRIVLAAGVVILLGAGLLAVRLSGSPRRTSVAAATGATTRTPPSTKVSANLVVKEYVLQGRPGVSDVLLDHRNPMSRLGREGKNNRIAKQKEVDAFLILFALDRAAMPPGARIEQAKLNFYVWDPPSKPTGPAKLGVFPMKTPWDEAQATWQQPADGRTWQGGSHFVAGKDTDRPLAEYVIIQQGAPDHWKKGKPIEYAIDITPLVCSSHGGQPNHGLALIPVADYKVDDGLQSNFQVYASEFVRTQFTPKLTIRAKVPAP